jgi:hypothetical protein
MRCRCRALCCAFLLARRRSAARLRHSRLSRAKLDVPVLPLHGGLDADEQDAALRPSGGRRIILATNLAETTLTVPTFASSSTPVCHKVRAVRPERAIDSLDSSACRRTPPISVPAAPAGPDRAWPCGLWDSRRSASSPSRAGIARVESGATARRRHRVGRDPRALDCVRGPAPGCARRGHGAASPARGARTSGIV